MMNVHIRAALDFASSAGCEQFVTEPIHTDEWVFDLMLTDVHNLVEVRVGLPVGSTNHDIFLDAVLEQPIPHLVYKQEVYLKNSVDGKLVRGYVKSLLWDEIISSPTQYQLLTKHCYVLFVIEFLSRRVW